MLYVDSVGCTGCRLKLSEWKKIMQESDTVFARKPEFVFFFQPKKKDEKELVFIFRQNGFLHPVFVDRENEFGKLNSFSSKPEYQCFLLDEDNKVIIVGNPSLNPGIWALFKKIITEKGFYKQSSGKKGGKSSVFVKNKEFSVLASLQKRKEVRKGNDLK
jgi:hypothetical protein